MTKISLVFPQIVGFVRTHFSGPFALHVYDNNRSACMQTWNELVLLLKRLVRLEHLFKSRVIPEPPGPLSRSGDENGLASA